MPHPATIAPETADDPITLQEACDIVFRGKITPWTLRSEAERGKINIFKIGKKQFTTLREARALCERKARDSISMRPERAGLSETVLSISERVAALNSDLKRKKN